MLHCFQLLPDYCLLKLQNYLLLNLLCLLKRFRCLCWRCQLPRLLLEADLLITLPVLKTHALTYFTGALKNQWGCLPQHDRILYHRYLDPLLASLQVRTADGSDVPATVRADMVWVLNGSETWSVVPREEKSRSNTAPYYEVIARDGPKWGPGITVDVVVRLRDAEERAFLLRAPGQMIHRTD